MTLHIATTHIDTRDGSRLAMPDYSTERHGHASVEALQLRGRSLAGYTPTAHGYLARRVHPIDGWLQVEQHVTLVLP